MTEPIQPDRDALVDDLNPHSAPASTRVKGAIVTHLGHRVEITKTFDDDTADVQRVDEKGEVELDGAGQPQWTPRVPFAELT